MSRSWLLQLVMLAIATAGCPAIAGQDDHHDRVAFTVSAETELSNDLGEVVLAAHAEHHDPARVAKDINAAMAWALDQVHGTAEVTAESGGYQTYPVYDNAHLDHWRGMQTLVLRSKRIEALNGLVSTLQQRLQVQSMRFTVSPRERRASETQLVDQALDHFKERALRIQQRLGATGYDIVNLKLGTAGGPRPFPVEHMTMARAAGSTPVEADPGTTRQSLTIDAVIQLHF